MRALGLSLLYFLVGKGSIIRDQGCVVLHRDSGIQDASRGIRNTGTNLHPGSRMHQTGPTVWGAQDKTHGMGCAITDPQYGDHRTGPMILNGV